MHKLENIDANIVTCKEITVKNAADQPIASIVSTPGGGPVFQMWHPVSRAKIYIQVNENDLFFWIERGKGAPEAQIHFGPDTIWGVLTDARGAPCKGFTIDCNNKWQLEVEEVDHDSVGEPEDVDDQG